MLCCCVSLLHLSSCSSVIFTFYQFSFCRNVDQATRTAAFLSPLLQFAELSIAQTMTPSSSTRIVSRAIRRRRRRRERREAFRTVPSPCQPPPVISPPAISTASSFQPPDHKSGTKTRRRNA
ncbi:hypothetical protein K402DRAFT_118887 [Aulographum hederae CBS 113979]|uniref:Secreted protein n=1 Tax=Aulographum hederae CBS 113979 TaxID=1176131 RepID=A0A6G1GVI4_9PEZI|nr:hypothetical protein K402DRAFT_118887 [Aulographum hederae CBS 113979]